MLRRSERSGPTGRGGLFDRCWRTVATGLAFAFIFAGGGLAAAMVLPLAKFLPGDPRQRSQQFIHRIFAFYLRCLHGIGLLRLEIEGLEQFRQCAGQIVIANHPSLLDVVILMALIPRTQCIVKHQLWEQGLLGGLVRQTGYIRNDLEADDLIAACRRSLELGAALIIFPEGTRTIPGQAPRFQRGFANLALMVGAAIRPVTITVTPPTLTKGERWWRIPPRRPVFQVRIGTAIDAGQYAGPLHRGVAVRRLVADLEGQYVRQLAEIR